MTDDELILESADYFQAEQSPNQSESSSNQELWCNALAREFEVVAEYDPRPEGCVQTSDTRKKYFSQGKWSEVNPFHKEPPLQLPPDKLCAYEALQWKGKMGVDLRPHIYDPIMKKFLLVDSGSMVTAIPPEPGDKAVVGGCLRAVNGSRINTYGKKQKML